MHCTVCCISYLLVQDKDAILSGNVTVRPQLFENEPGEVACLQRFLILVPCHCYVVTQPFWQGGVTPSIGDIEGALMAVKGSRTKVHVLIRPRPGDFVYSSLEKQVHVTSRAVRSHGSGSTVSTRLPCRALGNPAAS